MVSGSLWIFRLFDAAGGIHLAAPRKLLKEPGPLGGTRLRRRMPLYVRFERPPG